MKIASRNLTSMAVLVVMFLLICIIFLFQTKIAFAEQTQSQQSEANKNSTPPESEYLLTLKAAVKAATRGPARVTLIDQGSIDIPENFLFIPSKEAAAFMKANGNETGSEFVGLLFSEDDDLRWYITINFTKSGYVRDDDAKNWTADDLLKSIKEGNDEANKNRITSGFSPLEIIGWIESPKYNASTHQLIWSILAKDDDSKEPVVNYKTYVLGRDGYFKLNLITSNSSIAQDKQYVHKMLASLNYNKGKNYQDFTEGTDHIAEYGLAALITGVVAKKIGLLALAGIFLAKIWKLSIIIPIIFWGKIKKLFKGSSSSDIEK